MKNLQYILVSIFSIFLVTGCQEDDYETRALIAPSNIQMSFEIVGADINNPNGDGSGAVKFTASADNAITFIYNFGDNTDVVAESGTVTHRFSKTGVNPYTVTVIASGVGGIQSTSSIIVEVFSSFEDEEAKDFLSGGAGNSKTWYWAADKTGNIGLGPNTIQPGGQHTYSEWFTAGPWWTDKLCMYDAEFVFTQSSDGTELTFEQLKEIAYTPGGYASSIGVDGDTCHGTEVAPSLIGVKTVTFSPSNSIATFDATPLYRGTTMNISDDGFMCWYVGETSSTLEIIEITESTLKVRIEEGPNAWYCYFQTEKPIK